VLVKKISENKSLVEKIIKTKAFAYFLIFWGATFFVRAISDFIYYLYNYGAETFSETLLETTTWIIYDVFSICAAIALWVIAVKVLKTNS